MALGSKNKIDVLPEIQGKVIKAAREKLRLDAQQLAHKACLSKKHITELEEGGISSFYSETHKITVAKKVAKILELDESKVLVHPDGDAVQQVSLPFDTESDAGDSSVDAVVASAADKALPAHKPVTPVTKAAPREEKVSLENLQSGGEMDTSRTGSNRNNRNQRNWLPVLLLIMVVVGLYSSKDEIIALFVSPPATPQAIATEGAAEDKPAQDGVASASTSTSTPLAPASSVPATPAASAAAPLPTDVSCPKADGSVAEYSVTDPSKPGNFVYVQAKARQIVCVVDATGKSSMQSIDAGSGHTFVGKAPFTVLTNGVSQAAIYFQGKLVRVSNEQTRTIRLKEVQ